MPIDLDDIDAQYLERVFRLGYLQHPMMPDEAHQMTLEDFTVLRMDHQLVRMAMRGFQLFNGLRPDGINGDVTSAALVAERCGFPDFGDLDPETGLPIPVAAATGSGAWPAGCIPGLYPMNHATTFHVARNGMPDWLEPHLAQIIRETIDAYDAIGWRLVEVDDRSAANIHLSFENLGGNVLGLAQVGGGFLQCESRLWGKYNPNWRPADIVREWGTLWRHEIGHIAGLRHTNGGIMNATLEHGLPPTWRNDPSRPTLVSYYGGDPVTDPVPPGPEVCEYVGVFSNRGEVDKRRIDPPVPWADRWKLWT
jgi:hypothetical protein